MEAPPPAPSPRSPEAAAASASSVPPAAAEPPDDAIAHASSPPPSSQPPSSLAPAPLQPPCAPPPAPPEALPLTQPTLVVAAAVPTETHFASREQLLAHVHAFSLRQGYAVVIQKSNVPRGQLWLRCDLGGSYRSASSSSNSTGSASNATESRKRKSSSRLQNCPFQLYARRLPDARWLLKVQNAAHNHEVDPDQLAAHPVARRLTLAQKQLVDELTSIGARPAHIVEKLKEQFPDKPVKVQDIYNARNYIRRERGAGRVPFSQNRAESWQEEDEVPTLAGPDVAASMQHGVGEIGEQQLAVNASAASEAAAPLVASEAASAPAALGSSPTSGVQPGTASSSTSNSSNASSATAERLQTLLHGASTQFSSWPSRTQKQFLFQLEVLLTRCSKSESTRAASSSSSTAGGSHRSGAKSVNDESATDSTSSTGSADVAAVSVSGGEASSSAAASSPLVPQSTL